jgi:hypothetical protein
METHHSLTNLDLAISKMSIRLNGDASQRTSHAAEQFPEGSRCSVIRQWRCA